jgi:tetratricopeptide (TPR) repeat protein
MKTLNRDPKSILKNILETLLEDLKTLEEQIKIYTEEYTVPSEKLSEIIKKLYAIKNTHERQIAALHFQLGDFEKAKSCFSKLVNNKEVGRCYLQQAKNESDPTLKKKWVQLAYAGLSDCQVGNDKVLEQQTSIDRSISYKTFSFICNKVLTISDTQEQALWLEMSEAFLSVMSSEELLKIKKDLSQKNMMLDNVQNSKPGKKTPWVLSVLFKKNEPLPLIDVKKELFIFITDLATSTENKKSKNTFKT